MRWSAAAGACLLIVSLSVAVDQREVKEDDQQPQSSIARAQWQDVQHPNHERSKGLEEKEETEDQFEQARRVRVRNGGKRRRRLRKRPRTTTPSTGEEHAVPEEGHPNEEQYPLRPRWSQEDSVDYLPVDGDYRPYRRRPGKRRRRPLRKQHYADQPQDPQDIREDEEVYRRRRKGYRKRIRIQDEISEDGTPINEGNDHKRNQYTHEEGKSAKTETSQSKPLIREDSIRHHNRSPRPEEVVLNLAATRRQIFEQQLTTTARTRSEETQIHDDFRQLIKNNRFQERLRDKSQKQDSSEKKETKTDVPERNPNELSEEKIFDRKSLFSTSRRLPQTSAVIRRRLRPKNTTSSSFTEQLAKSLVPKGYNKQMPEIIPPHILIEEMMSTKKIPVVDKDTTEEPNYPKTQPRTRVKETTPKIDTSSYMDDQPLFTTIEDFFKVGKEPQTTTFRIATTTTTTTTTTTERPKSSSEKTNKDSLENFNLSNIEDHILDLLLTKNSSSRLSKILELRNMTLFQLIQHRERGSSQLHFSGGFNKQNITTTERGEFYINDNVKNDVSSGDLVSESSNLANNAKQDLREPRIFDSLPDFNRNSLSEVKTQTYPTWSVIPNPDLTPVSINKQERPPVTRATIKPVYNDNIEEIILIEDNAVDRFPGSFNLNIASRISDGIKTFKKFPPGVKSAIIVSMGILVLAIIGFLSVLISCRVRQKRSRLRAKRDVLNEQLHNEEFMNSQRSLSPVLSKNQPSQPSFTQGIHSNTASNRHYYLWRTLRKTFQYD